MNEIPGRILREKAADLKRNSPWHCQVFCTWYRYFGVEVRIYCFNITLTYVRVISDCIKQYKFFIKIIIY